VKNATTTISPNWTSAWPTVPPNQGDVLEGEERGGQQDRPPRAESVLQRRLEEAHPDGLLPQVRGEELEQQRRQVDGQVHREHLGAGQVGRRRQRRHHGERGYGEQRQQVPEGVHAEAHHRPDQVAKSFAAPGDAGDD
jgi:hypothetical protein